MKIFSKTEFFSKKLIFNQFTGFHGPGFHLQSLEISQCCVAIGFAWFLHINSFTLIPLTIHVTSRVEYPLPQPTEHYFKESRHLDQISAFQRSFNIPLSMEQLPISVQHTLACGKLSFLVWMEVASCVGSSVLPLADPFYALESCHFGFVGIIACKRVVDYAFHFHIQPNTVENQLLFIFRSKIKNAKKYKTKIV